MLKRIRNLNSESASALVAAACIALSGCGKDDAAATTSAVGEVKLSDLPSASSMIKTNSGSSARLSSGRTDSAYAVSGTAPLIGVLGSNPDQYFWNGLVATINAKSTPYSTTISNAEKDQFWGVTTGGPGGSGACYMAQSVGEAFGRMLESGTTLCYMKGISSAAGGITVSAGTQADIFQQTEADKLVKIAVTGGFTMDVWVKVSGTNSVTSDAYKLQLHFCEGSTVTGAETLEVNKATGVYTSSSSNSESGFIGSSVVTAYLKKENGSVIFDAGKNRSAVAHYSGPWGKFKSDLIINSSNQIISKMRSSSSYGSDKVYAIAGFAGSSLKTLQFLEAGFKGVSGGSGYADQSYSGGTEWKDTFYAAADNALKTTASAVDFTADPFYSESLTAPTVDLTGYSCSLTPDITVGMDFTSAAVAAVQTTCEGDRFNDYSMCDGTAVRNAETKIYQSYQ